MKASCQILSQFARPLSMRGAVLWLTAGVKSSGESTAAHTHGRQLYVAHTQSSAWIKTPQPPLSINAEGEHWALRRTDLYSWLRASLNKVFRLNNAAANGSRVLLIGAHATLISKPSRALIAARSAGESECVLPSWDTVCETLKFIKKAVHYAKNFLEVQLKTRVARCQK